MTRVIKPTLSAWQVEHLKDPTQYISCVGGYYSGKSHQIGPMAWLFANAFPGLQAWVCNNSDSQTKASTYLAVRDFLEQWEIDHLFTHDNYLYFPNGSSYKFQTLGVPKGKLKGANLDLLIIDEADVMDDLDKFKYLKARVRGSTLAPKDFPALSVKEGETCRRIRVYLNPCAPVHWAIEEFKGKPKSKLITVETYDNAYADPEVIKQYETDYPPGTEQHDRWMRGKLIRQEGAVFKEFNQGHIVEQPLQISEPVMGVDWGSRDPTAILGGGWTEDGFLYINQEFRQSGLAPSQRADLIKQIWMGGAIWIDTDPAMQLELQEHGVQSLYAEKRNREANYDLARHWFLHNWIFIDKSCKMLIDSCYLLEWKPGTLKPEPKHNIYRHLADALVYIIASQVKQDEPFHVQPGRFNYIA